jgi:hypothetical protein
MMHKASVHINCECMKDVHCCIKCTHTLIYLEKERAYSEICGIVNCKIAKDMKSLPFHKFSHFYTTSLLSCDDILMARASFVHYSTRWHLGNQASSIACL